MKRIVALLLCVVTIFVVSVNTFATETDTEYPTVSTNSEITTEESTTENTTEVVEATSESIGETTDTTETTESTTEITETTETTESTTETTETTETTTTPQPKPEIVKLVSAVNVSDGVKLKWKAVDGADTYRIYRRKKNTSKWSYRATVTTLYYTDKKTESGTEYFYTVRGINEAGMGSYDKTGIKVLRLADPTNVKSSNQKDSVKISWSAVKGAKSYRIYKRLANDSKWSFLGSTAKAYYTDKSVKNGKSYRYTVRAVNGSTLGGYNQKGILIKRVNMPKPQKVVCNNTGVTFYWYKVSGETSYRVYRSTSGNNWKYLATTKKTYFKDKSLKKGKYYRYTVRAVKNGYLSAYDSTGIKFKFYGANGRIVHGKYDNYVKPGTITDPTIIKIDKNNWNLTIVNAGYRIPSSYTPNLTYVCGSGQRLDKNVAVYYERMYKAALADGVNLTPFSGYRSYQTQETLFNNKINLYLNQGYSYNQAVEKAATIVMPPGSSEHNLGYAMDIVCCDEWFENTKEFKWLQKNAADYGFIMRYPKEKQNITKVIYEPWHWRYVGVKAAKAMKQSGLVLEEYLGVTE